MALALCKNVVVNKKMHRMGSRRCCRPLLSEINNRTTSWKREKSLIGGKLLPLGRSIEDITRHRCYSELEEKSDAEETTVKYGLEAGLWKVFTSKDENGDGISKGEQAKQLLKRYGSAYLVTSISFAIVSFAACYALVNAGVDVAGLLTKVGLRVSDTSEKVGTFAIAYAAHKALSPVRFPPTVALTPVVAKWLGKESSGEDK
jgi:hypothetical protein